ncbi:MAG: DUF58 domain-containing protein [Kiritimatiellae bacterium]|nr:DUF58 domain-containing protein [Kiritimatiellia bacterium]
MSDVPHYMRLLPSDALNKIGRLEFLAHGTVDGFISGKHRSARKGASVEFAEHRQYAPGDDLRNLDWKLIARRQRFYVKQYVDETNLRATILLDTSGSMKFRGDLSAAHFTKLEYGQYLAASLAYLLVQQQDAVGFVSYDTKVNVYMSAKAQPAQLRRVLTELDGLKPGGDTDSAAVIHEIAERIPHRSVIFLISDLFGDVEEILNALHHFRFRHHEVIVLHVMAEEEIGFPYDQMIQFEDAESTERLNVDATAIRREYLARVHAYMERLERGCGEMSITHELLSTRVPFDQALADVLVKYHVGR